MLAACRSYRKIIPEATAIGNTHNNTAAHPSPSGFLRSPPATNRCSDADLNLTGPARVPSLFARLSALRQLLPSAC